MKKLFLFALVFLAIPSGMSARKSGQRTSATLNLSPTIWVSQDTINVTGSGYKARKPVAIDVVGPIPLTVDTVADSSGQVSVQLPYTAFAPGSYTASAYQTMAGTSTLMATTGFEAQ
jgi:hypothetical protein